MVAVSSGGTNVYPFVFKHAKGSLNVAVGTVAAHEPQFMQFGVPTTAEYATTVRPIAEGRAFVFEE